MKLFTSESPVEQENKVLLLVHNENTKKVIAKSRYQLVSIKLKQSIKLKMTNC